MYIMNIVEPYDKVDYKGIQYAPCCDYKHIS